MACGPCHSGRSSIEFVLQDLELLPEVDHNALLPRGEENRRTRQRVWQNNKGGHNKRHTQQEAYRTTRGTRNKRHMEQQEAHATRGTRNNKGGRNKGQEAGICECYFVLGSDFGVALDLLFDNLCAHVDQEIVV